MSGDQVYLEIAIFAMIAVFLVFRLRSVLGRRHGEERPRPNPYRPADGADPVSGELTAGTPKPADTIYQPGDQRPLAAWLQAIQDADPSFNEKTFLSGARAAFEMIVDAFSHGDRNTLRPLLSDDVFGNFDRAIREREAAGHSLETRIERFQDVDIVDARLDGRDAFISVRYVSEQTNVTRDRAGVRVDGGPEGPEEVTDTWTFARDLRSRDPNWVLVETRSPS